MDEKIISFLNRKVAEYNQPSFIKEDPISIPHSYSKKQDIEVSGLFAAVFAWGNRTIIINKTKELMGLMDHDPHNFILHHKETDLKHLLAFKHRTFNTTDLLYFIQFLNYHYSNHGSLETAFTKWMLRGDMNTENALIGFHQYFFSLPDAPPRTRKHIATPMKNSTCKRMNMFLRWMVRKDKNGVDFGIWTGIKPSQLVAPIDLHVGRVAKKLGLISRNAVDWKTAVELTDHLKQLDPRDPVKYDFALFGLGVAEKF